MSGDGEPDGNADGTLDVDGDALAGVVDLFGALTRAELRRALEELAFKRGTEPPDPEVVDRAIERYALVAHGPGEEASGSGTEVPEGEGTDESEHRSEGDHGRELLVPGPSAFPSLPPGTEDLPHIMDVPSRTVDREAIGRAVEARYRADVARALASGDDALVGRLLDVSYDLDAWGLDLSELRARLDDARE